MLEHGQVGLILNYFFSVEGSWASWGACGACSSTCGTGSCTQTRGYNGHMPCSGNSMQSISCNGELSHLQQLQQRQVLRTHLSDIPQGRSLTEYQKELFSEPFTLLRVMDENTPYKRELCPYSCWIMGKLGRLGILLN